MPVFSTVYDMFSVASSSMPRSTVHILQIQVEVFHAVAATAENGEDGPNYLAVLIANKLTAKPQVGVDYRGKNTVKSVQNEKYSAKSGDFLRFFAYLCHAIDDFACLDLQH